MLSDYSDHNLNWEAKSNTLTMEKTINQKFLTKNGNILCTKEGFQNPYFLRPTGGFISVVPQDEYNYLASLLPEIMLQNFDEEDPILWEFLVGESTTEGNSWSYFARRRIKGTPRVECIRFLTHNHDEAKKNLPTFKVKVIGTDIPLTIKMWKSDHFYSNVSVSKTGQSTIAIDNVHGRISKFVLADLITSRGTHEEKVALTNLIDQKFQIF